MCGVLKDGRDTAINVPESAVPSINSPRRNHHALRSRLCKQCLGKPGKPSEKTGSCRRKEIKKPTSSRYRGFPGVRPKENAISRGTKCQTQFHFLSFTTTVSSWRKEGEELCRLRRTRKIVSRNKTDQFKMFTKTVKEFSV